MTSTIRSSNASTKSCQTENSIRGIIYEIHGQAGRQSGVAFAADSSPVACAKQVLDGLVIGGAG